MAPRTRLRNAPLFTIVHRRAVFGSNGFWSAKLFGTYILIYTISLDS